MKEIQILIGNIGSGKTTYCKQKAKEGYLIISKDDVRYSIGAGKYIFNPNLEHAIDCSIKTKIFWMGFEDVNLIIDETNMDIETRQWYIHNAKLRDAKIIGVVFPKISKNESVKRRLSSNHGNTSKETWEEVWERKNEIYEEPTKDEGFNEIIYT